jgi:hypothetical protein
MKYSISDILLGLVKTIVLLVILEIFSTAILPAIGIVNFKPAFSVLIVLFMAFKLETPILPYLILIIQYVHSAFSIEGWGIGTLAGIIVALSVRYLRDLLQFSSAISTIVVVQIFQMAWFVMVAFMLCLKMGDFSPFFNILWRYTPESFLLSLLSPFFFLILDKVWLVNRKQAGASI